MPAVLHAGSGDRASAMAVAPRAELALRYSPPEGRGTRRPHPLRPDRGPRSTAGDRAARAAAAPATTRPRETARGRATSWRSKPAMSDRPHDALRLELGGERQEVG